MISIKIPLLAAILAFSFNVYEPYSPKPEPVIPEEPEISMPEAPKTPSVKEMLTHALQPVGNCLYVYGGAWNEEDTAAGVEALSVGVSPRWEEFFNENDSTYNYKNTRYQIHDGLDCTGYVGWTMYQIYGDKYSNNGYVVQSKNMAAAYAEIFQSELIKKENVSNYMPGDIMCSSSHVYMVIGECSDGSVVFLHASPPVVSICGTYAPDGTTNSEAVQLAKHYMSTYYPKSYKKFPTCHRNTSYLKDYNQVRLSDEVLSDPDGYKNMTPAQILEDLFI